MVAGRNLVGTTTARTLHRGPLSHTNPPVGAGLLAKASCQSIFILVDPPPSRASPLPQGTALLQSNLHFSNVYPLNKSFVQPAQDAKTARTG
ncbi:hypothetical protein EAH78_24645 [Pseudomonas arsenicoxydans]|uniref:Uncharacterized protein n=1 Tax=Pseudomonas arsenicoxydans TaxID=702115 RepID=A0A502HHL3_9PSED|nr:hypothetical protein EAH78_24645 [Pseudomonas arsenicoxydans]